MKRVFTLLFAVLLVVTARSTGFDREHPSQYHAMIDGVYYYFYGDEAEVTYDSQVVSDDSYASYSGDVVIPESVTYNNVTYRVTRIGYAAFLQCNDISSLTLPNSITTIEKGAFLKCQIATPLIIPQSVNSIGWFDDAKIPAIIVDDNNKVYDSRDNCNAIIETSSNKLIVGIATSVIPNSVTKIEEWAFRQCTGLTAIEIPNSVTWIGDYAFSGCTGLTSIEIPNSVKTINSDAFNGCSSLTTLTLHCPTIGTCFKNMSSITDITFGDEVVEIYAGAFSGTTWYSNKPDGLIYAGKCVYEYKGGNRMAQGTNIVIEEGTKGIAGSAFKGCEGMTSVIIPNSVTTIGSKAFSGCKGLTTVTIPSGVIYLNESTFSGCSGLTTVNLPENLKEIRESAFADCSSLTSVVIPKGVTTLASGAFARCSSLASINIPNSVTEIRYMAFSGCSSLTAVTIPSSVKTLGSAAFDGCSSLVAVTVERAEPIYIYATTFSNSSNAVLYVPSGSKANYEAASYWSGFKEIIEYTPKCATPIIHYKGGKLSFECETAGVTYVSSIITPDASDEYGKEIDLNKQFKVNVYAKKDGYDDSEIATEEINVQGLKGDVNGDGVVSITDAVSVVNIILNNGETGGSE